MSSNQPYLTVYAVTKYIKRKFDADPHLTNLHIKGEISNFKRHSSGHFYFTLKDKKSKIPAVMFSSHSSRLKFVPENGMMVMMTADISVYEASGNYQLYVKQMEPEGIGALFLAYEQLKERLQQEGLFNDSAKRPLPLYPKTIGVITSPTGAVIRDILTTIKRRYPIAVIKVYPASVQGDQAAPSLVNALKKAGADQSLDVVIIGRGGGSIEELWPFNEESVAREIARFPLPIVSAVGHETDVTIADFVADRRAPTPTAAAELVAPHLDDVLERLDTRKIRMNRAMRERINEQAKRLERQRQSVVFRRPERLIEQSVQKLDQLDQSLVRSLTRSVEKRSERHQALTLRLRRAVPTRRVTELKKEMAAADGQLNRAIIRLLKEKQQRLSARMEMLDALSPLKIMNRGYSLVYDEQDQLILPKDTVQKKDRIRVERASQTLICSVEDVREREQ